MYVYSMVFRFFDIYDEYCFVCKINFWQKREYVFIGEIYFFFIRVFSFIKVHQFFNYLYNISFHSIICVVQI